MLLTPDPSPGLALCRGGLLCVDVPQLNSIVCLPVSVCWRQGTASAHWLARSSVGVHELRELPNWLQIFMEAFLDKMKSELRSVKSGMEMKTTVRSSRPREGGNALRPGRV